MMLVPPCGQSFQDNEKFRLYYCPAVWNRRNAEYLDVYSEKRVRAIGHIVKVVPCEVHLDTHTVTASPGATETLTKEEKERVVGATEKARTYGWDVSTGHKFYLCDGMQETDFRKTSPGGIWGHRYFDLEKVLGGKIPNKLNELAARLRRYTWESSPS